MEDDVTIERDGRAYTGRYRVRDDVVTVTGEHGERSVRLAGSAPDVLARMMLRELVQRSRTRYRQLHRPPPERAPVVVAVPAADGADQDQDRPVDLVPPALAQGVDDGVRLGVELVGGGGRVGHRALQVRPRRRVRLTASTRSAQG